MQRQRRFRWRAERQLATPAQPPPPCTRPRVELLLVPPVAKTQEGARSGDVELLDSDARTRVGLDVQSSILAAIEFDIRGDLNKSKERPRDELLTHEAPPVRPGHVEDRGEIRVKGRIEAPAADHQDSAENVAADPA